jgi:hypothetical protein
MMKLSYVTQLLVVSIGMIYPLYAVAMPPAPAGPYVSIEDNLRQQPAYGPPQQPAQRPVQTNNSGFDRQSNQWNWGGGSMPYHERNQAPYGTTGRQNYQGQPQPDYRRNPMGVSR